MGLLLSEIGYRNGDHIPNTKCAEDTEINILVYLKVDSMIHTMFLESTK